MEPDQDQGPSEMQIEPEAEEGGGVEENGAGGTRRRSGRHGGAQATYNEDRIYAMKLQEKFAEDALKEQQQAQRAAKKRVRSSKGGRRKGGDDSTEEEDEEVAKTAAARRRGKSQRAVKQDAEVEPNKPRSARAAAKAKSYKDNDEYDDGAFTDETEVEEDMDVSDAEEEEMGGGRRTSGGRKIKPTRKVAEKPARKQQPTRKRKSVPKDPVYSDFEISDDEDEGRVVGEDDDSPQPTPAIIGRRTLTAKQWNDIADKMYTRHVTRGSLWHQPPEYYELPPDELVEKYLVKWVGLSHLHVSWETERDLIAEVGVVAQAALKRFFKQNIPDINTAYDLEDYFPSYFMEIDRILDIRDEDDPSKTLYMVKWISLGYGESTWENATDLKDTDLEPKVEEYRKRQLVPPVYKVKQPLTQMSHVFSAKDPPTYKNGGQLRSYQWTAIKWMTHNYLQKKGSILADEMGLGKTVQSVTFLDGLYRHQKVRGPFLVVAPLSTLHQWYREISTWTDLNGIMYQGTADDRRNLRRFEFHFPHQHHQQQQKRKTGKKSKQAKKDDKDKVKMDTKFQVMLTTPANLQCDDRSYITEIDWEVLILDEAHKLKRDDAQLVQTITNLIKRRVTICLTGTPLQNNVEEFFTLLQVCNPDEFTDKAGFMAKFGDLKESSQLIELQQRMAPFLLRREKEVVEQNLPPKTEIIVEVEMTEIQKKYYRAIYDRNIAYLAAKNSTQQPQLLNLQMEVRKCCNHPFLVAGVEDTFRASMTDAEKATKTEADFLVEPCGKLVLMDKLLPKLKAEGHRVLIFSHFKIMLNVLEDYLNSRGYTYGRIDGSIKGEKRQAVLDRYCKPGSDTFIMLLTTKAGGEGINLMAADTVILYDSDWNPQHEIQAQARCHRIGQTKPVTVYRLISPKSYESEMFTRASKRLGLHHAVLQSAAAASKDPGDPNQGGGGVKLNKEEVESLLKEGAYQIFMEEKTGQAAAASRRFAEQDIDEILAKSAHIEYTAEQKAAGDDGAGGAAKAACGLFSKAKFHVDGGIDVDLDDPEFWKKVVGKDPHEQLKALEEEQRQKAEQERAKGRQARKRVVNYDDDWTDKVYGSDDEEKAEEGIRDEEYEPDSPHSSPGSVNGDVGGRGGGRRRNRGGAAGGGRRRSGATGGGGGGGGAGGGASTAGVMNYQNAHAFFHGSGIPVDRLARVWEAMMRKGYSDPLQLDAILGENNDPVKLRNIVHELIALLLKNISQWDPNHPDQKLTRAKAIQYCTSILEVYTVPKEALTALARDWLVVDNKVQADKFAAEMTEFQVLQQRYKEFIKVHESKPVVAAAGGGGPTTTTLTKTEGGTQQLVIQQQPPPTVVVPKAEVTIAPHPMQPQQQVVVLPIPGAAPDQKQVITVTAPIQPLHPSQLPPPIPTTTVAPWLLEPVGGGKHSPIPKLPPTIPPVQLPASVAQLLPPAPPSSIVSASTTSAAQQPSQVPTIPPPPRPPTAPRPRVKPDDSSSVARWLLTHHKMPSDFPQPKIILGQIFGTTCATQSDILKGLENRRLLDELLEGLDRPQHQEGGANVPQLIRVIISRSDFVKYPAEYWDPSMSEHYLRSLVHIGTVLNVDKYNYIKAFFGQKYAWVNQRFPDADRLTLYFNQLVLLYRKIKRRSVRLSADVTYPGATEVISGAPPNQPQQQQQHTPTAKVEGASPKAGDGTGAGAVPANVGQGGGANVPQPTAQVVAMLQAAAARAQQQQQAAQAVSGGGAAPVAPMADTVVMHQAMAAALAARMAQQQAPQPTAQGGAGATSAASATANGLTTQQQLHALHQLLAGSNPLAAAFQKSLTASTVTTTAEQGGQPPQAPAPATATTTTTTVTAKPKAPAPTTATPTAAPATAPTEGLYKELPANFLQATTGGLQVGAGPSGTQVLFRPSNGGGAAAPTAPAPSSAQAMTTTAVPPKTLYQAVDPATAPINMASLLKQATPQQQQTQAAFDGANISNTTAPVRAPPVPSSLVAAVVAQQQHDAPSQTSQQPSTLPTPSATTS